jgi:hypothetical protein
LPARLLDGLPWRGACGFEKMIGLLKSYGDGSDAQGILAVAALLSTAERWDGAEEAWVDTTKRLGVYPFHTTDFLARERDTGRKKEVLTALSEVISDTAVMGSAGVLNHSDWSILPNRITLRLGSPYLACATTVFACAGRWLRDIGHPEPFAVVFEHGDEGQGPFRVAIQIMLASPAMCRDMGVADVVFSPKGAAALEMADLFAWAMSHWVPEMRLRNRLAHIVVRAINDRACISREYLRRDDILRIAYGNSGEKIRALKQKYNLKFQAPRP